MPQDSSPQLVSVTTLCLVLNTCTGKAQQDVLEVTWLGKEKGRRDKGHLSSYGL